MSIRYSAAPFDGHHGGLTGLGDDDHTIYVLASGLRAITGQQSFTYNSGAPIAITSTTVVTNLNADTVDAVHLSGTGYTLTIPATGTAALLAVANVFTANQTISNTAPSLVLTDTTASAKGLTIAVDANIADLRESAGASGSLMVLDLANGRVGIGTTGPGAKLDVNGFGLFGTSGTSAQQVSLGQVSTYPGIWFGANTTTPSVTNYAFLYDVTTGTILNTPSAKNFWFRVGNGNKMTILASGGIAIGSTYANTPSDPGANNLIVEGRVGIGTTEPGTKLHVSGGDLTITGGGLNIDAGRWLYYGGYGSYALGVENSPTGAQLVTNYATVLSVPGYLATRGFMIRETSGNSSLFEVSGATRIVYIPGNVGIGTTAPTAVLHLKAGTATASTAPLKLTSGTLLGTAEAGAVEFLTDDYYATITTAAARKAFVLDDGARLTATRVPYATTNGRLTDSANLTTDGTSLTLGAGANLVLATSTGTKIATGTTQLLGFWNAAPVDRPASIADATGAGDVVAQLNLLLASIREVGLIAPLP